MISREQRRIVECFYFAAITMGFVTAFILVVCGSFVRLTAGVALVALFIGWAAHWWWTS